MVDNHYQYDY